MQNTKLTESQLKQLVTKCINEFGTYDEKDSWVSLEEGLRLIDPTKGKSRMISILQMVGLIDFNGKPLATRNNYDLLRHIIVDSTDLNDSRTEYDLFLISRKGIELVQKFITDLKARGIKL